MEKQNKRCGITAQPIPHTADSMDIKRALAKRHNREFFLTEVKDGATQLRSVGDPLRILDAVAIFKSWAHPCIVGYEIKISRADFLRDSKFYTYLPLCHELYIVTPKGLIDRAELPDNIGLVYYNPDTEALTTKKKPPYRNIEISADFLMYILMSRVDNERIPFCSDKREYFENWLKGKASNRELGYLVKSKMAAEITRLEHETAKLPENGREKKILEEIYMVMKENGLQTWGHMADTLDHALKRSYPEELDMIQRNLENSLRTIEHIKEFTGGAADEQAQHNSET